MNLEPRDISPVVVEELRRIGRYTALDSQTRYGSAAFRRALAEADVLWTRLGFRIDKELLDMAPQVRVVATPTTGLAHVDRHAIDETGVTLLSLQGDVGFLDSITATAELAWLLVLALRRRLVPAARDVLSGRWERDRWKGLQLAGHQLGVVGMGRLGRVVAGYGRAFRMEVVHADPIATDHLSGTKAVDLIELLSTSDVITLHASLNPTTRNLMGPEELGLIPDGAILVNTARGELVDEVALLATLRTGRLGGVATDVLADEVRVTAGGVHDHPLVRYAQAHDDLIITPHIGGACWDAMEATELHMAHKLADHLSTDGS